LREARTQKIDWKVKCQRSVIQCGNILDGIEADTQSDELGWPFRLSRCVTVSKFVFHDRGIELAGLVSHRMIKVAKVRVSDRVGPLLSPPDIILSPEELVSTSTTFGCVVSPVTSIS